MALLLKAILIKVHLWRCYLSPLLELMSVEGNSVTHAPIDILRLCFVLSDGRFRVLRKWFRHNTNRLPHPWGERINEDWAAGMYCDFYQCAVKWSERTGQALPEVLEDLESDWEGQWSIPI